MIESDRVLINLTDLTRDLILFRSATDRPIEIERCLDFIINHIEAPGAGGSRPLIEIEKRYSRGVPSVVALPKGCALDDPAHAPEILFTGHIDVVSVSETADYASHVKNGRIYGPGAADMKAAVAVMVDLFRDLHLRFPGISLGLAITSDEETGGDDGIRFLFEDCGLRAGAVLLPDSGSLTDIAIAEKGILHLRLTIDGPSRHGGHAARPWLVANPLEQMLETLSRITSRFAKFAIADVSSDHWHPTCAVTDISTPRPVINCIPARADAVLDIRFTSDSSADEMLSTITALLPANARVEALYSSPPTSLNPDPLFVSVTEEITGRPARLIREHGGSDAGAICKYGIPIMMSRPLIGNMHSFEEWVDIESLLMLRRIYERYICAKMSLEDVNAVRGSK